MIDLGSQRLLVIAPHPDDDVLGCGGFMHKIKKAGGSVFVLFLTLGTTADYSKAGKSTAGEREREIEKVMKFLKVDDYGIAFRGNKYHLKLDAHPLMEIINSIEKQSQVAIVKSRPTILAVTQNSDYNQDHRAAWNAAIAATRPAPHDLKPFVPVFLGYEFAANGWTVENPKVPNFFVSLSEESLNAKIRAMQMYSSQIRGGPHTRSEKTIEYLAKLRGSQTGSFAAEAFYSHRFYL